MSPNPFDHEENIQSWLEKDKYYQKSYHFSKEKFKAEHGVVKKGFNLSKFWRDWKLSISLTTLSGAVAFALIAVLILTPSSNLPSPLQGILPNVGPATVKASEIEIKAVKQDSLGVSPDTYFLIQSKKDLSADEMKKRLSLEPSVDFEIEKALLKSGEYYLKPKKALAADQVYKINFLTEDNVNETVPQNLGWAFQVQDQFRILNTFPRDKATNVSLNSGIEINFSSPEFKDYENFVEITPKPKGKFEKKDKTLVYAAEYLEPKTLYTVKIKAGLSLNGTDQKLLEDKVFQFETTLPNDTGSNGDNFADLVNTASPKSPVYMLFYGDYQDNSSKNLQVYKYNEVNNFVDAVSQVKSLNWSSYSRSLNADPSKMQKVLEVNSALQESSQDRRYLTIPQGLDTGYYLVQTESRGKVAQTLLQISDLGISKVNTSQSTLLWLADLNTKKPLSNADVVIQGSQTKQVKTDENGVLVLDIDQIQQGTSNIVVKIGDRTLVLDEDYFREAYGNYTNDAWSYITTDRPAYKTVDTINFWGFLKKKNQASNYEVVLSTSEFDNYYGDNVVLSRQDISVNEKGTFSGKIDLKGTTTGYYSLEIKDKKTGEILKYYYVNVINYSKPVYKLSLESNQEAYINGDTVKLTGKAEFYSGAPVKDLELKIGIQADSSPDLIKTDAEGNFNYETKAKFEVEGNYTMGSIFKTFQVSAVNPEEAEIAATKTIYVYPKSTSLAITSQTDPQSKNSALINFELNQVDTAKQTKVGDGLEYLGKAIEGQKISVFITESEYVATQNGTYYDFYAKQSYPSYEYNRVERSKKNYEVTTGTDGKAQLKIETKPDRAYDIEANYTNGDGKNILKTNIYNYAYAGENTPGSISLEGVAYGDKFKEGDKVNFTLTSTRKEMVQPDSGNKYLLILTQDRVVKTIMSDKPDFSFDYTSEFAPGIYAMALVFNGKMFGHTYEEKLPYDYSNKELKIEVQADKETYKPREKAKISIKITDKNGSPVAAKTYITLVDESIFDQFNEPIQALESLYQINYSGFVSFFATHEDTVYQSIERGGFGAGGGDEPRSDFKDTVIAKEIETDANGLANIEVALPDNLTSWRITTQSITSNLQAGTTISNIKVSKPFFIDVVSNEVYLEADKPALKLRSFGGDQNQTVNYEINSESLGIKELKLSGRETVLNLDNLTPGVHTIKISGSNGELTDAIERKIEVVRSFQSQPKIQAYNYKEGLQIEKTESSYATVKITDAGLGRYFPIVQSGAYTINDRLDQLLGGEISNQLLNQYYQQVTESAAIDWQKYLANDGYAIYPYADADSDMSVQMAIADLPNIDKLSLEKYFTSTLNSSKESRDAKIKALLGLAALKKYNLVIAQTLAQKEDLSLDEKLDLGLTLALSGDLEKSRAIFNDISKTKYEVNGGMLLKAGDNLEKNVEVTTRAAYLGSLLSEDFGYQMLDAVQTQYSQNYKFKPMQLLTVKNYLKMVGSKQLVFNYELDGQIYEITLDQNKPVFSLRVESEKLAQLKLTQKSGNMNIIVESTIAGEANQNVLTPAQAKVSITRTYLDAKTLNPKNSFAIGETVKVSLKVNISNELPDRACYMATDYLPAGLKPSTALATARYEGVGDRYPTSVEDQKVTFCLGKGESNFNYYARVVSAGEYKAESASLEVNDAGQRVITPSQQIIIK